MAFHECWTSGCVYRWCCDVSFGPAGNPYCWDHTYTFDTCCKKHEYNVVLPAELQALVKHGTQRITDDTERLIEKTQEILQTNFSERQEEFFRKQVEAKKERNFRLAYCDQMRKMVVRLRSTDEAGRNSHTYMRPSLREHIFGLDLGGHDVRVHPSDISKYGSLRIHVYDFSSEYHREAVESAKSLVGDWSPDACGVPVRACPVKWHPTPEGKASFFYSIMAEVVFMRKLVALLEQAGHRDLKDPSTADLFVVPVYFGTLNSFTGARSSVDANIGQRTIYESPAETTLGREWSKPRDWFVSYDAVLGKLPYYNARTKRRHIFLRSIECGFGRKEEGCLYNTPDFITNGSVALTFGPRLPRLKSHRRQIIVPSVVNVRELQPNRWRDEPLRLRPRFLLLIAAQTIMPGPAMTLRGLLVTQLAAAVRIGGRRAASIDLEVLDGNLRIPSSSLGTMLRRFRNSTFCPCPPGDQGFGPRFYWSLLSLCIPVMIKYDNGGWFKPDGSTNELSSNEMLPFNSQVRYRDLVIEVPIAAVESGQFLEVLEQVPQKEIFEKRRAIKRVRSKFVYDFDGSAPDAFSSTMQEVMRLVKLWRHY